jgi:hypothetical protein
MGQLLGKEEGKVEEKDGKQEYPDKDGPYPQQGDVGVVAADQDQLTGVPAHEGKNQQGKDPIGDTLGVVQEDDQTESQVYG